MVGDAAYCPSPISGMGTTLAIIGAYVLAGELSQDASVTEAFKNYEEKFKPFVQDAQKLPPGIPRIAYPKTFSGIKTLNFFAGIIASKPLQYLMSSLSDKKDKNKFILPNYNF
ncbi:MAG: hypothetical protein CL565_02495 [Alphaproteobacteria bacterium]|nr:hypothetical protein [Alphaproteobacteria bacterium]|tara:strand:- start:182 stop:520 length:339 start_codon:yes stop_codon:yes gene_type:complete